MKDGFFKSAVSELTQETYEIAIQKMLKINALYDATTWSFDGGVQRSIRQQLVDCRLESSNINSINDIEFVSVRLNDDNAASQIAEQNKALDRILYFARY